jgi:hypothetical protein
MPLTTQQKFERGITRDESGCWLWNAGKNTRGYGSLRVDGKCRLAHRVSLFLHQGMDLTTKLFVCHRCDNPPCVNPDHLFIGRAVDNTRDMLLKKRNLSGKARSDATLRSRRLHFQKLTSVEVLWVVEMRQKGLMSVRQMAEKLKVKKASVRDILKGRTWSHVTGIPCPRHTWIKQGKELVGAQ